MTIELMNKDCTDWLLVAGPKRYDHVITDPPYDYDSHEFERDVLNELDCRGNMIFFCKPENQLVGYADEYLFWIKTPSTKNYTKKCGRFVEIIQIVRGDTFNPLHWSQMTGVYDDRLIEPTIHPYQKPLTLIERLVRIYTNPGDTILDPFMGSGTTGEACANLGRNFIGIEKDRDRFEVAKNRLGV
jgi:DNA modification methylase